MEKNIISHVFSWEIHMELYLVDSVADIDIEKISGPKFENHPMFPDRVNTEFIELVDDKTIKMRVWERGAGETLACGTGACASAYASYLNRSRKEGLGSIFRWRSSRSNMMIRRIRSL